MTSQLTGLPLKARQVAFCVADNRAKVTQMRMPNSQRRCARRESMAEPKAARPVCHTAGMNWTWATGIRPAAGAETLQP